MPRYCSTLAIVGAVMTEIWEELVVEEVVVAGMMVVGAGTRVGVMHNRNRRNVLMRSFGAIA